MHSTRISMWSSPDPMWLIRRVLSCGLRPYDAITVDPHNVKSTSSATRRVYSKAIDPLERCFW